MLNVNPLYLEMKLPQSCIFRYYGTKTYDICKTFIFTVDAV
jgi:hypothetical protein